MRLHIHLMLLDRYIILLTPGTCTRVTVVVLCVCVSVCVTKLTATYLVCESQVQACKIPYGVPNACTCCIVWISLKALCSPVLASFADAKLLDFFPTS